MSATPRYAVIFVSQRSRQDDDGYAATAARMDELVRQQDGFVEMHSVREGTGRGITVAYWTSLEAIARWRQNLEHAEAQVTGRQRWYQGYQIVVAEVERVSNFGTLTPHG
jgi:heme-degrading monooxygenase HmoA